MRRVAVAVACIKVASQAVAAMPSVLLFPLLPFVLEVGGRARCRAGGQAGGLWRAGFEAPAVSKKPQREGALPARACQRASARRKSSQSTGLKHTNMLNCQVGLIVYWVAVAAVLYSAGAPTAHWRDAANSTAAAAPVGLPSLSLGLAAAAAAGRPDTSNMTAWVGGGCGGGGELTHGFLAGVEPSSAVSACRALQKPNQMSRPAAPMPRPSTRTVSAKPPARIPPSNKTAPLPAAHISPSNKTAR